MCRRLARFASVVVLVGLLSPLAMAQPVYDFDGSPDDPNFASDPNNLPYDPTDWMTSVNWNEGGADPDPFFEPIPDLTIRVEIEEDKYGANAPVIGPGDTAQAFGVRIGRAGGGNLLGEGLLTMNGGTLEIRDGGIACQILGGDSCSRLRVGNAQVTDPNERFPGTFDLSDGTVTTDTLWIGSGSHGTMNMSGGVVNTRTQLYFDWTIDPSSVAGPDPQSSELNMTGGTINVATVLFMHRTSVLNLDGGDILVAESAELGRPVDTTGGPQGGAQDPNVTVSITDGLLRANGFLQIGGSITVDGGILRANSFNEAVSTGTVDINGGGLLQFRQSNESVAAVEGLITSGWFTTMDINGLDVTTVDVSGTLFTQVSVAAACGTGDFDCNGVVDGEDFLLWQLGGSPDGGTQAELALWETNYGTVYALSAVASVPEPSSVVLAMLLSVSMVFRCRNFFVTSN